MRTIKSKDSVTLCVSMGWAADGLTGGRALGSRKRLWSSSIYWLCQLFSRFWRRPWSTVFVNILEKSGCLLFLVTCAFSVTSQMWLPSLESQMFTQFCSFSICKAGRALSQVSCLTRGTKEALLFICGYLVISIPLLLTYLGILQNQSATNVRVYLWIWNSISPMHTYPYATLMWLF